MALSQNNLPGRHECRRFRCALSTITMALAETSAYGRGYREQVNRWQHRDHAVWRHTTRSLCCIHWIRQRDWRVYPSRDKLRVRRLECICRIAAYFLALFQVQDTVRSIGKPSWDRSALEADEAASTQKRLFSWSWAGWVGRVAYDEQFTLTWKMDGTFIAYDNDAYGQEGVRPLVRWHVWDAVSRRVVPLNHSGLGFPFEGAEPPAEWENGPCYFDNSGNRGPPHVPPVPNNGPWSRSNEIESRHLMFWTSSSITFRFGIPIYQKSDQRRLIHSKSPPLRYQLIDTDSQNLGTVLLDDADRHGLDVGRPANSSRLPKRSILGSTTRWEMWKSCPLYFGYARCTGTRALSSRI